VGSNSRRFSIALTSTAPAVPLKAISVNPVHAIVTRLSDLLITASPRVEPHPPIRTISNGPAKLNAPCCEA
jgi:hypothetical protein